jgi:DNA repair protein RAD50
MSVDSVFLHSWFILTYLKMHELMKKASPEAITANQNEMTEWEEELERLQKLRPVQATKDKIKAADLPALEAQIKDEETSYPEISARSEEVT